MHAETNLHVTPHARSLRRRGFRVALPARGAEADQQRLVAGAAAGRGGRLGVEWSIT